MPLRSFFSRSISRRSLKTWGTLPLACAFAVALAGCPTVETVPVRDATATKWLTRAGAAFELADMDDARDSVAKALSSAPGDDEVRLLSGKIHLSMLDYAEALKHLKGIKGSEAAGLRGRALWYKGDLEAAADELDALLNDPDVVDDWAKSIAKLARRGAGRAPFTITGGLLAAVEMPRVNPSAPYFVVPLEIDGEAALALIATGSAEVVLDSTTRPDPSWVSLRFGGRIEVQDVPALTQDLSGLSKQVGAPVKAILGVNLLRHVHATIDWQGRQFVVRSFSPPPPPDATRIPLFYVKGGGMLMKSTLGDKPASLLIDTSLALPMSLDEAGWKKAGIDIKDLKAVPEDPEKKLKEGLIPLLKLGSYEITQVPGFLGVQVKQIEEKLSFNLDGLVGNGLLAYYRMTLADGGRLLWLEDNLAVQRLLNGGPGSLSGGGRPTNESVLPEGTPTMIVPDPKTTEPPTKQPGLKNPSQGGNPGPTLAPPGQQIPPGNSKGP